jgi:hypothetical protein
MRGPTGEPTSATKASAAHETYQSSQSIPVGELAGEAEVEDECAQSLESGNFLESTYAQNSVCSGYLLGRKGDCAASPASRRQCHRALSE